MIFLTIVGARPQFIKVALLHKELKKHGSSYLLHTGQHYDENLSGTFFQQLEIGEPDFNLAVGSGSHGFQTANMLIGIEKKIEELKPDWLIVVGDTNSTLAGALAACKMGVKIAHIEAGQRNFDWSKPEEKNRILTDHVTDLFIATTPNAVENLSAEGKKQNVHLVGDLPTDVLFKLLPRIEEESKILEELKLESKGYYVLTIHKSKHTDDPVKLKEIFSALAKADKPVLFPIHPRTKAVIESQGLLDMVENCAKLIEPQSFFNMIKLIRHAKRVVTDSGGIQKEAYNLQVPCITLRETEWVETVEQGWNKVIFPEQHKELVDGILNFNPNTKQAPLFGDGTAYLKTAKLLLA